MREQVCVFTDDPLLAWMGIFVCVGVVGLLGTLAEEIYKRGFNAGRESMRRQVHRVGFEAMREAGQNKYAAAVAWRVVRRVFGA